MRYFTALLSKVTDAQHLNCARLQASYQPPFTSERSHISGTNTKQLKSKTIFLEYIPLEGGEKEVSMKFLS